MLPHTVHGRRCNVTTLDMTPAHVQELINDAQSMPAQVPTEGLRIEPALVSLHVEYKVHDDPMSDRVLALRQYALLIFSVLVLCGTATNGPWLPAPCCEWLHGAPGETCWAALHEGIGQVDDTVRVLCSSVPCVHHCLGGCTDGKGESGCGRDARDANHSQLECGESGMVRSIEAEASKSHNGACKGKDGDDDFQERDEPKANGQGAAHASADSSAAKKGARPKLDAITGARLLASLHVAATHLSRLKPPAAPPIYILGWGFTWVPWFFMLSGYILAYARLSQPKRDGKSGPSGGSHLSPLAFCHRRLASVYPLYLLGVCISLLTLADRGKLFTVRPSALLSQVFLLQAWLPSETEHALQSQCWFLSAIVPFWLLHQSIVTFVDRLPTRAIFKLLMLISLVPWILLVLLPPLMGVPHEWYTLHKWKAFKNWVDVVFAQPSIAPPRRRDLACGHPWHAKQKQWHAICECCGCRGSAVLASPFDARACMKQSLLCWRPVCALHDTCLRVPLAWASHRLWLPSSFTPRAMCTFTSSALHLPPGTFEYRRAGSEHRGSLDTAPYWATFRSFLSSHVPRFSHLRTSSCVVLEALLPCRVCFSLGFQASVATHRHAKCAAVARRLTDDLMCAHVLILHGLAKRRGT